MHLECRGHESKSEGLDQEDREEQGAGPNPDHPTKAAWEHSEMLRGNFEGT